MVSKVSGKFEPDDVIEVVVDTPLKGMSGVVTHVLKTVEVRDGEKINRQHSRYKYKVNIPRRGVFVFYEWEIRGPQRHEKNLT